MEHLILENLDFGKYHGLGNDYIIINDIKWNISEEKKSLLAQKLGEIHISIGADGLLFVCDSKDADIKMRIFNNDGLEAEMCGNGIRCFAKYIYENDIVIKEVYERFRPKEKTKKNKKHPLKDTCGSYFTDMIMNLGLKEPIKSDILDEEDFKDLEKSMEEMTEGMESEDHIKFIKGYGSLLFAPLGKLVEKIYYNENVYYGRKHISALYVAKKDLGDDFIKVIKKMDKKFKQQAQSSKSRSPKYPYTSDGITDNKIEDDKLIINLHDIYTILKKNYLKNVKWKGLFLPQPKKDSNGFHYVFYDDIKNRKFGVIAGGPNFKLDYPDNPESDDVMIFMSYDDLSR